MSQKTMTETSTENPISSGLASCRFWAATSAVIRSDP